MASSDSNTHPNKKRRIDENISRLHLITEADRHPPAFQQPYQLLSFSHTSVPGSTNPSPHHNKSRFRKLEWNNDSMKYFVTPPIDANLSYGYKRWIKRPEERARLDGLLQACTRKDLSPTDECRIRVETERRRADLITWRGIGTKLLIAPYEQRDSWHLNVMQVNGTIYLEEHATEEELKLKTDLPERQRLMTYYGYAFESYCTTDSPPDRTRGNSAHHSPKGWGDGVVDTNVQWCSVVKTKLGDHRLIFGGEVDCVRDKYTGQPDTFVELKTSIAMRPGNADDKLKFEKKLLKFYFQSFLLGVPEIVVGFRSPKGYLQDVQSFKTLDLPRLVRGKPHAWNPSLCLTWGEKVISFLKRETRVHGDDTRTSNLQLPKLPNSDINDTESTVWRLTFTPGVGLSLRILDQEEVAEVVAGEDRVGFLPRWYWNSVVATNEEKGKDAEKLPETRAIGSSNSEANSCGKRNAAAHINPTSQSKSTETGWNL